MTEGEGPTGPPPGSGGEAADLLDLARDWITLWQSELSALATDREAQEVWQTLLGLWAGAAGAMLRGAPRGVDQGLGAFGFGTAHGQAHNDRRPTRGTEPAAPAWAAPAGAASDPRDAEIERLHSRILRLEERLAELEGKPGAGGRGTRRGARHR